MSHNYGFPAVSRKDARILILGSMPGVKSLEEQQYYAHPRNAFWPIMCELFNAEPIISYTKRKRLLIDNKIALWDVLKSCERKGSLDSNINNKTIEPNDFNTFFKNHQHIQAVFFNGGEAEKLFKKYILKELTGFQLEYHRLPSTSPANAAKSRQQKMKEWKKQLNQYV